MKEFILSADELYTISKSAFYSFIPDCEVNFVDGYTQMFFNLRKVAAKSPAKDRRKIIALVISKCSENHINRFVTWLTDYFSNKMMIDIFGLTVDAEGNIKPEKTLEKALINIRKR